MSAAPLVTTLRAKPAKVAIVFLHGFGGNAKATWGEFPNFIANDSRLDDWDLMSIGYTTRLVPDIVGIWSADAPLERLSLLLHAAAIFPPLDSYNSLALVAHSMGGLIVQRALVDHADLAARVSNLFLFATPSGGLAKAGPFRFLKRQVRDMAETSEFILDLRKRWKDRFASSAPFRLWTAAGDQDEFVPSDSSLQPFEVAQRLVVPGNHTSIVKPQSPNDLGLKIVLNGICGDAAPAGPGNAARVALESREFLRTIKLLEPHQDDLDPKALVDLALAFEEMGRQSDAIALLEKHAESDTDAMGVLAGRLKRRWLVERRRSDAERVLDLYRKAYGISSNKHDDAQAFYHGINIAFMELAYGSDHQAAQAMARRVLDHCRNAKRDFWRLATEGDAHVILGETEVGIRKYREAIQKEPQPRWLKSMYQQALRVADLVNDEEAELQLNGICRGEE